MPLSLSVPIPGKSLSKEIETNPKKARAWVESLPMTKVVDAARLIAQNLAAFNQAKMSADDRVELVEIYRPVVLVLLEELEAIYAYNTLPLPMRQRDAFELARELRTECCTAYKILLMEKSGKMIMFNAKKNLPAPLVRAMRFLRGLMLQCYKTYHPAPEGVWLEAYKIYQYAEEQGLHNEPGDETDKLTVSDIFTEMVMVSLADPYRLMNREIEKVSEFLLANRGLMELRANADGLDPQRLFVVALDADQAPKLLVQGNKPPAGQIIRVIHAGKLVERLQQKLRGVSGAGGASAAKGRAIHDLNDLYARLSRLWGDPPKRQFRRNPAESPVALCAGIKAVAYFAEMASTEDPEADAQAIREGDTIPLLKIPDDPTSKAMGVEQWVVLNQSANGLRLHREEGGTVGVTVGEAIGIRFVGGRTWNVGVVRWLTLLEGDSLEFGMELMSPAAFSVSIAPTIGTNRAIPALLLQPLTPEAEADTLMTVTDTFADLREFELNDCDQLSNVRATTLIERTGRFDMFQFQPS